MDCSGCFSPILNINYVFLHKLSKGNNHVLALGNFYVEDKNMDITFPTSGKWYEFFSRDSIEISSTNQNIALTPEEYRLYSTRKFDETHVITEIDDIFDLNTNISIYPNPANYELNISCQKHISELQIFSSIGEMVYQSGPVYKKSKSINIEGNPKGIYVIRIIQNDKISTNKIIVK